MKQKRITARRVKRILEAIEAEDFTESIELCARWKISPKEWRFLLLNSTGFIEPAELAEVIRFRRKERQRK